MKKIITLFIIFYCIHLSAQDLSSILSNYFQQQTKTNSISGAFLVAHNDTIIFNQAFGFADVEHKILNSTRTEFLIGSITKIFTAIGILKLAEQHKLCISDTISKYLPRTDAMWNNNYPAWADEITIDYLLTHRSGLPDYTAFKEFSAFYKTVHTGAEFLQFIAPYAPNFKPGTKYEYGGAGYNILGIIIEKVTKQSYGSFLQNLFFTPLSMNHTYAPHTQILSDVFKTHSFLSKGYFAEGNKIELAAADLNLSTAFAEASIISTTMDVYIFLKALLQQHILSKKSLDTLFYPHVQTDTDVWMGYGFMIIKNEKEFYYTSSGKIKGYQSRIIIDPQNNVIVIGLSNVWGSAVYKTIQDLYELCAHYFKK